MRLLTVVVLGKKPLFVLLVVAYASVFVLVLLFAMKNTDPVTLHFYLGQSVSAPRTTSANGCARTRRA